MRRGALEPEIKIVLDNAGLSSCFKIIVGVRRRAGRNRLPICYLLAIGKLRDFLPLDAAACVAIEDSRWGLEAAHKAGLRTVAVTHTYPASELPGAELVVKHLRDITIPKLEKLWD